MSLRKIPAGIWVLGFVSLCMDISSEMIHALLPVFMITSLGASAFTVGLLEGLAESTALLVKVFSGVLSDALGRRKPLALFGYGLGAATKPFFALATVSSTIFAARLADRIGKGVRGAPRDALVADLAPPEVRGAAFGLRQSLDTIGAFLGPLLAVALMLATGDDFRTVFWWAVIPAVLSVGLLAFGIREPAPASQARRPNPLARESLRRLGPACRSIVVLGAVFSLARFSEAFLVLRAQTTGVPLAFVPFVMVVMNVVYASSAYPFGKWSDRMAARDLLAASLVVLVGADLILAAADSPVALAVGVVLWGLHMGMSQGLLARMVADVAPPELRGTAFGAFNFASGLALLIASGLAGFLWETLGPPATFLAGAGFAASTWLLLRRF